jgi:hypothetical protein
VGGVGIDAVCLPVSPTHHKTIQDRTRRAGAFIVHRLTQESKTDTAAARPAALPLGPATADPTRDACNANGGGHGGAAVGARPRTNMANLGHVLAYMHAYIVHVSRR